jgi:aryl-alcohol dehydrogenase-like predicted oxidoreductase
MRTRTLGPDGLVVSAIGLGCWGMSRAYGPVDDAESLATLNRAIDIGVTFLDTATSYGAGHNEGLLAQVVSTRRDEVVLASKFGILRDERGPRVDGRPENVRGYCEASLARLGVDHIDLYYLHRIDPNVPIEDTVGAMAELVAAGIVRHLGLSEASAEALERAAATHTITAVQNEWSLWWRDIEDDVLPTARRLGIGVVPYSPLGRGFLTGAVAVDGFADDDLRRGDPRFLGKHGRRNQALLARVQQLARQLAITPGQLALAWLLAQGHDVVPIPGTKHIERVVENALAPDIVVSSDDLALLESYAPRDSWSGDRLAFAALRSKREPEPR